MQKIITTIITAVVLTGPPIPSYAQASNPSTLFSLAWMGLLLNSQCKVLPEEEAKEHADNTKFYQASLVEAHGSSKPLTEELKFAFFTAAHPSMKGCGPGAKEVIQQSVQSTRRITRLIREHLQQDRTGTLAALRDEGGRSLEKGASPASPAASSASN